MVPYTHLISSLLPVFGLIGIGWFVRHIRWISAEGERNLMALVIRVLYPCLIFKHILDNQALREWGNLLQAPIAGFIFTLAGIYISYLVAPWFRIKQSEERRSFALSAGISNYGYIAIPVTALLFHESVIGVLLVFNIGVELVIWTVGIIFLTGKLSRSDWKKILNPPVIAMLIATPINLTKVGPLLPSPLIQLIESLAACAIPIGLIMIGTSISDLTKEISLRKGLNIPLGGCLTRLAILPLVSLGILSLIPLTDELQKVVLVQAAMPSAVIPIILTKYYDGGRPGIALQVALTTMTLGILLIPLWLKVGMQLLNIQ